MSEAQVVARAGTPTEQRSRGDGSKIFIYRLRLYKGPEPFSNWPRQVFLTSETKVVFDRQGNVTAVSREP